MEKLNTKTPQDYPKQFGTCKICGEYSELFVVFSGPAAGLSCCKHGCNKLADNMEILAD